MPSSFTTLWTNDHILQLTRDEQVGTILDLLLGGPHQSPEIVERIRYRSQRKERSIKHLVEGRITRIISLHGVYRLSNATAEMFRKLLEGTLSTFIKLHP